MAAAKKIAEDEDNKPEGDVADLPKKKIAGKKLMLIIVALVVLLLGAGAGLYFSGVLGGHAEEATAEGEHGSEEGKDGEEANAPVFYELPQILVNLQSGGRRPTFLKLKVNLQIKTEEDRAAITAGLPRIMDSFQLYLRELSQDELQGTAGLERLREELRLRVSAAVAPTEVKDILFTEMIFGQ